MRLLATVTRQTRPDRALPSRGPRAVLAGAVTIRVGRGAWCAAGPRRQDVRASISLTRLSAPTCRRPERRPRARRGEAPERPRGAGRRAVEPGPDTALAVRNTGGGVWDRAAWARRRPGASLTSDAAAPAVSPFNLPKEKRDVRSACGDQSGPGSQHPLGSPPARPCVEAEAHGCPWPAGPRPSAPCCRRHRCTPTLHRSEVTGRELPSADEFDQATMCC
jgi:hypothetical protein